MKSWFWILGWSLSILTITGNGFIIFLVCRRRQLRTKTNAFVVSLAVADFCVGMTAVPFLLFPNENHVKARPPPAERFIKWFFMDASAMCLCILVLDRYMAVVKPLKYLTFMKRRRVIQMVFLSWAIPVVFSAVASFKWFSYLGLFQLYLAQSKHPSCLVLKQTLSVLFSRGWKLYFSQ